MGSNRSDDEERQIHPHNQETERDGTIYRDGKGSGSDSHVTKFLKSLPPPDISSLPPSDLDCVICARPYLSEPEPEKPTQMPCGHIFGHMCIFKWISSNASNANCPMCRRVLITGHKKKGKDHLQRNIEFQERLVANPGDIEAIMEEARVYTEERISAARRCAERRRRPRNNENPRAPSDSFPGIAQLTASRVSAAFHDLILLDLFTSEEVQYEQWTDVKRQIECVRRQLVSSGGVVESPLWSRKGPGLTAILNPFLRPLVHEYMEELTRIERCLLKV